MIDQKDNSLKIGELAFTLDGRENTNELGQGLFQKSKTHWEGAKLVTEWVLERDGQKLVTARQVRSLADNGKTQIGRLARTDSRDDLRFSRGDDPATVARHL